MLHHEGEALPLVLLDPALQEECSPVVQEVAEPLVDGTEEKTIAPIKCPFTGEELMAVPALSVSSQQASLPSKPLVARSSGTGSRLRETAASIRSYAHDRHLPSP
jgi:hypothetical protein